MKTRKSEKILLYIRCSLCDESSDYAGFMIYIHNKVNLEYAVD